MDWIKEYFEDFTILTSILGGKDNFTLNNQQTLISLLSASIKDSISINNNYKWSDILKEDLSNILTIISSKETINSISLYFFDSSTNKFHLEISSLEDNCIENYLNLNHKLVAPVLKTKDFFCFREKRSLLFEKKF